MGLMDNDMDMQSVENRFKIGKLPADRQVGGDHYSKMKIQPSRFARANDYDCDAFSILKYLSRHRSKKGREDVEKALSFVYIRLDNAEFAVEQRFSKISIEQYCLENEIDDDSARALFVLNEWVISGYTQCYLSDQLKRLIQHILETQYPVI